MGDKIRDTCEDKQKENSKNSKTKKLQSKNEPINET